MGYTPRTRWSEADAEQLVHQVQKAKTNWRELAPEVQRVLDRNRKRHGWPPLTCGRETLRKLGTGQARTTRVLVGLAIEEALDVPEGRIFTPKMERGTRAA